jgi:hypothetical protein
MSEKAKRQLVRIAEIALTLVIIGVLIATLLPAIVSRR